MRGKANGKRIAVAYGGVHQIFQIALAAHEMGELERFYCSVFDGPGKWGKLLSRLGNREKMMSRRCEAIDPAVVSEHPWPWLRQRIGALINCGSGADWFEANEAFDRWAAAQLEKSEGRVLVGAETCARYCFEAARTRGMIRVLDAPAMHPTFVEKVIERAAADTGIKPQRRLDSTAMAERKQIEFSSTDLFLVYSDVHRQSYAKAGYKSFFQCPLWVDSRFWAARDERLVRTNESAADRTSAGGLKVLFVGAISLRKGFPYLLKAVKSCGSGIKLTLVGTVAEELHAMIRDCAGIVEVLPTRTKVSLRKIYQQHDVLVIPSLADSFGFVGLEAMACGLPVIVTENCGVPVPDPAWRVPVMNSEAIAQRLEYYKGDGTALARDSEIALQFARQFTPERYRNEMKSLFNRLLS